MANEGILQKLMGFSPHIEMIVRRLYRNPLLNSFLTKKKSRKRKKLAPSAIDFNIVLNYLKSLGIAKGDVLIVHSAYSPLKGSGLKPQEIVDQLLDLVGNTGTLCMPVIRKYPESPEDNEALTKDVSNIQFHYDVKESKVWTGIIPKLLMQHPQSVTSRYPLNTMTAVGPHAEEIMKDNINGDLLTPNGVKSSWKKCTDLNAWVVCLGVDMAHSLTMIHTAEDVNKDRWPIKGWYRKKNFTITDGSFTTKIVVQERHPKWGMLHYGERKLSSDLINDGIVKYDKVEGLSIESLRSMDLFRYLNNKNKNGYPYYWT